MTILFVLIGLAVMILVIAIAAFFWAVNNKQFDDLDGPAYRVLFDDEPIDDSQGMPKRNNNASKDNTNSRRGEVSRSDEFGNHAGDSDGGDGGGD